MESSQRCLDDSWLEWLSMKIRIFSSLSEVLRIQNHVKKERKAFLIIKEKKMCFIREKLLIFIDQNFLSIIKRALKFTKKRW